MAYFKVRISLYRIFKIKLLFQIYPAVNKLITKPKNYQHLLFSNLKILNKSYNSFLFTLRTQPNDSNIRI